MFLKRWLQKVKNRLDNRYELFHILDLGCFNMKLSLMELDRHTNLGVILDIVEASYPNLTILLQKGGKDLIQLSNHIKNLFFKLQKPKNKSKSKHFIIGLSSELISGASFSNTYTREDSNSQIDVREIKNVIHNLLLRAHEDIRRKFASESGYTETEVILVNTTIQKLLIDGQVTLNPIGKIGKEIFVSLFNAYAPNFYKDAMEQIAEDLKFNSYHLVHTPYAVFSSLKRTKKPEVDMQGLIIDIGGKTTRVTLVKKGKIEDIRNFSFGGVSFTRRIANDLKLSEQEAENIKLKYSNYNVSQNTRTIIDKLLESDMSLFLNGLELILKDFSQTSLLPGEIFLCGGGGNIDVIDAIIKKRSWRKDLSFTNPPTLYKLDTDSLTSIKFADNLPTDSRLVSMAALADYAVHISTTPPNILDKILHRTVSLINE